jgi:hypothetical protein
MSQSFMHAGDQARGDTRQRKLIVTVVTGLVGIVAVLTVFLLTAGGSPAAGSASSTLNAALTGVASSSPQSPVTVPAAYTAPLGRNPFSPLVTPAPAGGAAASASSSPVVVVPSPTGLTTAATSENLTLNSVDAAQNTVNVTVTTTGKPAIYTVQNGKEFGTYFKLVSILTDPSSGKGVGADFQYGDRFVQLLVTQSAQLG